jgi:hypothetical protein
MSSLLRYFDNHFQWILVERYDYEANGLLLAKCRTVFLPKSDLKIDFSVDVDVRVWPQNVKSAKFNMVRGECRQHLHVVFSQHSATVSKRSCNKTLDETT